MEKDGDVDYTVINGRVPTRSTNNPVSQQKSTCWLTNRPVSYSASPLPSIRKITLFGK